ncbi:integrase catalytic domain-containing protein [Trichonephila clavata]|uniref:Integrase catalytic domain-containing protein n=1 Tax=Trichonephila clavata TaxID=2740835 RepID=A0A8X6HTJ6_TRICU|nr:integrase catalytic domain-containing protein [Trichonephila clavata]
MDAANQALLERAKRARSVSKSLVTKQINKLENEINNSADKTTVHEIYVQLISKYEELSTLDKEVESLINIESLEDEILTREDYRDKFIIWKIRAERYIGTVSSITFQNSVENQPQNVTPLNNTVSSVLTNQPRLPKLTLESFSGKDISSFPSFWARFKSAVDDNSNLNDVDKFSYLKSVVTSDAELAIRSLTLTPENYAKAVKILEDRFGRKELIVDYHMNRLLNLSPVRKSFDVIALRKLYDQLEINIKGLESLEIFPDSYSCFLFPIIMKAIPPDLALEYNKKHNEKQSQVTDLTTYLRGEVESRERTEILLKPHGSHSYPNKYSERAPPIYPQPNRKGQGHSRFYPSHKSGVRASANELLSAAVSNCLFCSEDTHASDMCENLCVQEKRAKLIKKGRCFLCCYTCCHVKKCKKEVCSYCKGRHARAICFKLENSLKQNSHIDLEKGKVDVKPTSSNSVLHNRGGVLLQCVKAEVIGHISSDKIFCLFDNGSEKSFIKKNVSRRLGLKKVGSERLNIFSFGCKTPKKQTCSKVEVRLRNILNREVTVIEALEIEEISKATLSLPSPDVWTEMETKGFRLTFNCRESSENCEISLLICSDFYWSLTHRIKRLDSSLVVVETSLGRSLQGKCDEQSDCTSVHLIHSEEESISAELRRFWEIESLGIRYNDSVSFGNGDEEILSEFDKSVCFVDGRYRVSLPWKPGMREVLQNNKTVARKRFEGLVRRFKYDHELFCEYKDVIDNYVREGIVERTSCDSLSDSQGFYLPHHAVIRSDKTTSRLRIVFDGSAHEDGHSSLNQSLYTGPNLHPNMLELLLRFRKNPVAFTADVKSAFLQIELDLRDREFTRFFWTDNLNNDPYVLNFTRVLFGLRPSPYLLAATLKHHFKKYKEQYPHTFDLLNSSIYFDDFICGRNDVPDALRTTLECLQIFSDASMLLRKWRTNSKQLDLLWQQEGVETEFSETSATDLKPPIKRFNLSVVGRIFDPIGILGPFVIKLKCLLQDLWTLGVDWDSELPPKLRHKWQQWSSEAEGLNEIKIPRFYLGDVDQELSSVDIHCFSDASKSAYGTILYLRFVTCNNKIETSFICSKSRVAPLKSLTLPRLELTAALLSARLAKQVSSCLKFNANTYYWTDSLISYYWIRGDSSAFKPYIKNRVQEIQLLSDPSQWGHCTGKDNPSDLISRGTSAVKLAQNELWWHRPPWLKLTPDHWPNRHRDILVSELCSEELEYRSSVHVAVTQQRESLVDINRFSSLKKLLKVTAWVFRFVNNARIVNKSMNFYITADEIQNAEYFWLKYVQYEFYSAEILTLKRNEQLRCSSEIKSLVPYLGEDNLLRITGRLLEADLCFGEKHPVILPRHCKFTELLVIREHERIGHCGVSATLTQLRKNYWMPKGRQLVKTIIRICLICKKYNAKPADQLSGQLPRDRITQSPPF